MIFCFGETSLSWENTLTIINTLFLTIIFLSMAILLFSTPILRKNLSRIFSFGKSSKKSIAKTQEEKLQILQEIYKSILRLKKLGKGATIVLDDKNETAEYISDFESLDSLVNSNLIINIFEGSKTPLHDGALIISGGRIQKASAYISNLSENKDLPKRFGTRHRSALFLSETTMAIIIVLSEETKTVRVFHKSKYYDIDPKEIVNNIIQIWK